MTTAQPPRRPVARRLLTAVAAIVAAPVVLTGCLYGLIPDAAPRPTSSLPPDTEGVPAELLPFYSQELQWRDCDGFDCTTVAVPLDWDDPGAGELELSVIRSRAEGGGEPIGSLITNPGGPGASGVQLVRDAYAFVATDPVREVYDLVGFDPRGVGESTAVRCYDAPEMDAYLFDIPENPRGSEAWEQELEERHRGFAEACEAGSDGILPYITTVNAARDMDVLRAVLGDTQLNYLGYSYGTQLGATYAELYPDRVGRLVLDGATDPSISGFEVGLIQGIGFESAFRAYMADCLEDDECPFRGTVDDAMADVATLLATVDRDPLPNADGRMLGADALLQAIVSAMYAEQLWPILTAALTDVLEGDPGVAFLLADNYYDRVDGVYQNNQTEAFRAYNCMDYPLDTTPEEEAAGEALLREKAPTVAPYWLGPDPCEEWPYPPTGTRGEIHAAGAAPIVVVGTTNDPATPYEWAVSLADQLESAVLITRVGEGHTGYNKGNACVDSAVDRYLVEGVAPDADLRCE